MMKVSPLLSLTILITILSCGAENTFEDHALVGNYLGHWLTDPVTENTTKITIEANEFNDGLILFLQHVGDTLVLEQVRDADFQVTEIQQNGRSINLTGELINDTLKMENMNYLLSDPSDISIRYGVFGRQ